MFHKPSYSLLALLSLFFIACGTQKVMSYGKPAKTPTVPEGHEVITFGAGCFWCVETVFQRTDGITYATSGYSNGKTENPTYQQICSGTTGHAEVVRVVFNPEVIKLDEVLNLFWRLHDPTTLNRQGNDRGTQYRSGIYFHNEEQKKVALVSLEKHNPKYDNKIVTEIKKAEIFYPAEIGHQDYYKIHGNKDPYCAAVIPPKLKKLNLLDKEETAK